MLSLIQIGHRDASLQWKIHGRVKKKKKKKKTKRKRKSSIDPRLFHLDMSFPNQQDCSQSTTRPPVNHNMSTGRVELICGPMFSGKTTEMMRRVKTAVMGGKRVCVIMSDLDTRYTRKDMVSSHDGLHMQAMRVKSLKEPPPNLPEDVNLIGVDEGHFLEGLAEFCQSQALMGRDVVVAALKADADRKGWPYVMELVPNADTITTLHAVCVLCQQDASCSRRLGTSGPVIKGVDVGADDKYAATCFGCWEEPIPTHALHRRATQVTIVKNMTLEKGGGGGGGEE
jgi:thymidine kinase